MHITILSPVLNPAHDPKESVFPRARVWKLQQYLGRVRRCSAGGVAALADKTLRICDGKVRNSAFCFLGGYEQK